ncbi:MAG TPA: MFS transporter [Massilia sp.]|nr:MFS transporter [Massilia sp.]
MSYRRKVAAVYLLGFFIDLINMFIAGVAYPEIGRSLHASVAALAWVSNSYIVGLTLVIPLSAWLTQRVGARRVILLSLSLFTLATAACGMANSLEALVLWRLVQGAGGGLLISVGQALAWQLYDRHERARLSSAVMLVGLIAPASSPAIGGLLVQALGWRWAFFASLPAAAIALGLAFYWLKADRADGEARPLDLMGLLMGCGALALTLLGLAKLGKTGNEMPAAGYLIASLILLILFVRHCRLHPFPLVDVELLKDPLMRFSMLIYQCVPGMFIGISLIGMLYLQDLLSMSPAAAGALMLPWACGSFLAIWLSGKSFNRLGPRPLIIAGCIIQTSGIVLLALASDGGRPANLMVAFALMGTGGSLCSSTAQSTTFLNMKNAALQHATALWNINRQLSFCFGVALLGMLFNQFSGHATLSQAYHWTFYCAAAVTLIPVVASLFVSKHLVKLDLTRELETR